MCFGCEALGGTDWGDVNFVDLEKAIHLALDLGLNFFDTAGVYGLGLSEKRLSSILGTRRHSLNIATKGGLSWDSGNIPKGRAKIYKNSSPKALKLDIESSLRRLDLDVLPIFYIHWPDHETDFRQTFDFLMTYKSKGYIKEIGCSNFSLKELDEVCNYAEISFAQLPYNALSLNSLDIYKKVLKKNNIKVVAYNVLAHGLLTGKFDSSSSFPSNDRRSRLPIFNGESYKKALADVESLKILARSEGVSLSCYSIRQVLKHESVYSVITGIKNTAQLLENFSAIN